MGHLFIVTFTTNYSFLCVIESHSRFPDTSLIHGKNNKLLSTITLLHNSPQIRCSVKLVYPPKCSRRFYLHHIAFFISQHLHIIRFVLHNNSKIYCNKIRRYYDILKHLFYHYSQGFKVIFNLAFNS